MDYSIFAKNLVEDVNEEDIREAFSVRSRRDIHS